MGDNITPPQIWRLQTLKATVAVFHLNDCGICVIKDGGWNGHARVKGTMVIRLHIGLYKSLAWERGKGIK